MSGLLGWFTRPWTNLQESKRELANSRSERERVKKLAAELREIHTENHISARVHEAFRGERP